MATPCVFLNPLQRDGTSQAQRLIKALRPTSVLVDERDLSDLLLYARRYATFLRYYTPQNSHGGNWVDFFEHDISTLVSIIRDTDYQEWKTAFDEKKEETLTDHHSQDTEYFQSLFSCVLDLARLFDSWQRQAIKGLALDIALQRLIPSVLNDALRNVLVVGNRAAAAGYLDIPPAVDAFSSFWDLQNLSADLSLFSSEKVGVAIELEEAVNRLSILFDRFHEGLVFTVSSAPSYLDETLERYPEHQPHMALFLAFLKIFEYAQQHLNSLTGKHLEFYFHDVLGLELRSAVPDQVHLVFELAKTFSQHRVKQDTEVKAGKDATGTDLLYATDSELIVNRTVLSEEHGLKSVFVQKHSKTGRVVNIFAAPQANSADGVGAELKGEEKKWPAFGHVELPFAKHGFAVASPMFLLAEGLRTITVTFQLLQPLEGVTIKSGKPVAQELHYNVMVEASGKKGWLPVSIQRVEIFDGTDVVSSTNVKPANPSSADHWSVTYVLQLEGTADPVVGYNESVFKEGFATKYPIVKFVLKNEGLSASDVLLDQVGSIEEFSDKTTRFEHGAFIRFKRDVFKAKMLIPRKGFRPRANSKLWQKVSPGYPYHRFQHMEIKSLLINVNVKGVRNLILENDVGLLDPAKPFHPFGPVPRKNSSFLVGSPEVFQKPVTNLDLSIQWADLPEENFKDHYEEYKKDGSTIISGNDAFSATVLLLKGGTWEPVNSIQTLEKNGEESVVEYKESKEYRSRLFAPKGSTSPPQSARRILLDQLLLKADPNLGNFDQFDTRLNQGFFKIQLKQSFLHSEYPRVLADSAKPRDPDTVPPQFDPTPNPPYTPLIAEFTLDYQAEVCLEYSSLTKDDFGQRVEQVFQIGPFGHQEIYPIPDDDQAVDVPINRKLVPEYLVTVKGPGIERTETAQGTWYLGFEQVTLPQNLSLLIQVAEGSEDPSKATQTVMWSYLTKDGWIDFKTTEIIAEGTNGLLTSGVLKLALPQTMVKTGTLMPSGIYWIKASVFGSVEAVPKMIAVHPQAVVASFRDQRNDPNHLATALPGQTISKLKTREAAIKSANQPYASFGGRMTESDEAFSIRVSECLRHKERAVTIFDYERLVLEHFPEVYKVKCVNHTKQDSELAPGHVRLVVVPNLRNKNAVDPFRPQLSRNRLERVKALLAKKASNFVEIEVANPHYEEVRVDFQVRFHPGRDKGFYTTQLNHDIIRFLSPWLYDEVADLTFGGRIHRSSILKFVEDQEYVDFVTEFTMDHILSDGTEFTNVEEANASSSSSALVAAAEHRIGHEVASCLDGSPVPLPSVEDESPEDSLPTQEVPKGFPQYMGNRVSRELHDLSNPKPQCQTDEIAKDRRIYFKKISKALFMGYDYCAYCFSRGLSQR